MGRHNVPAGAVQIARVGAALALALAVANCGKSGVDPKYGVSASPRVVDPSAPVPKGGGTYRVGKPYQVAGRTYIPEENTSYEAEGVASWYGDVFHGRLTANGEVFDMNSVSAAHPTLPLPSYVRVTNLRNNRSLIVRVNDRGPFHENRVIDVSVRFQYAKHAMYPVMTPDTPIGHAPKPPSSASWARNTTNVPSAQMIQEKACGFVRPRCIERMYGTKMTNVRTMAAADRSSLCIGHATTGPVQRADGRGLPRRPGD